VLQNTTEHHILDIGHVAWTSINPESLSASHLRLYTCDYKFTSRHEVPLLWNVDRQVSSLETLPIDLHTYKTSRNTSTHIYLVEIAFGWD
jgi:hypothetical protein